MRKRVVSILFTGALMLAPLVAIGWANETDDDPPTEEEIEAFPFTVEMLGGNETLLKFLRESNRPSDIDGTRRAELLEELQASPASTIRSLWVGLTQLAPENTTEKLMLVSASLSFPHSTLLGFLKEAVWSEAQEIEEPPAPPEGEGESEDEEIWHEPLEMEQEAIFRMMAIDGLEWLAVTGIAPNSEEELLELVRSHPMEEVRVHSARAYLEQAVDVVSAFAGIKDALSKEELEMVLIPRLDMEQILEFVDVEGDAEDDGVEE